MDTLKQFKKPNDKKRPADTAEDNQQANSESPWSSVILYVLLTITIVWFWQTTTGSLSYQSISYSQFKSYLANGEVTRCAIGQDEVTGHIQPEPGAGPSSPTQTISNPNGSGTSVAANGKAASPGSGFDFHTIRVDDPKLVDELQAHNVAFSGSRPSPLSQFLFSWIIPIGIFYLIWSAISGRVRGIGQSIISVGSSKAKLIADKDTGVSFNDIAGCDEAKYELQEVVDFLKNPKRYELVGAKIPKGVLLVGPPGSGKTLLARAVAGEAKVPFFSISGSEFIEMFVGVGAARVRDLFEKAKSRAPCIVFIDELDAIGRHRGVRMGPVNDEREQTLNQLLVGLDGFEANIGVVVLAATNRPEVLDPALLRPGRFDRQIVVDAPDRNGREAILRIHSRDKPLSSDVDLGKIAQECPGFSGADLANVVNEAALLAARHGKSIISQSEFEEAVEKVVAGPERRSRRLTEEEKQRVAYHESGHALVSYYGKHGDQLHKISIVPHGRAALGYTLQLPEQEHYLRTQNQLKEKLTALLGGRAAEELMLGEVSTGAENDLQHATALARQLVCMYGMSKVIGLSHLLRHGNPFLPEQADGDLQRDCSEQTAREIDQEVKRILAETYSEAKDLLQRQRPQLELVAGRLMQSETLDAQQFKDLLGSLNTENSNSLLPQKRPSGELLPLEFT